MAEQFGTDPWPPVPQEGREAFVPLSSARSTTAGAFQQAQRTWLPILTLYLLAPLIAEMLTGSTPPLMWNNVGGIILTTGLYGSGAVLVRELARRRGLSWSRLALLGAAYGVLEEGMAYQSWFNPHWVNPPDAARLFQVNWTFALIFTAIHVTLSIMSSVIIAETLFPQLAERPWLSRKGFVGLTLWLLLIASWFFFTYGFLLFRSKGYDHPPVTYALALLLFILFLWLGLRRRTASAPAQADSGDPPRPAPRLWTLRLAAFGAAGVVLANLFVLRILIPIALIPIGIVAGVELLSVLLVRQWAKRSGWGVQHRLALVSGVMGVFVVAAPILEFVIPIPQDRGLTLVNLCALGGLIWLAWRVKRQGNRIVQPSSFIHLYSFTF